MRYLGFSYHLDCWYTNILCLEIGRKQGSFSCLINCIAPQWIAPEIC